MQPADRTTVEEYLRLDEAAEEKLELLNGVVVAQAGASPRHNLIVSNVLGELRNALRERPCLVFGPDQRVRVAASQSFVYPDVVVVYEEPRFDTSARPPSLENPALVVEVLSESTQDHDLGAKLGHYRRLPSVQEILFASSERRALTLVSRQGDGSWKLVDLGPEGAVEVAGVRLTLAALYDRAESVPG